MARIRLTTKDLGRFFTIDSQGNHLTLGGFLQREKEMQHYEEIVGAAGAAESGPVIDAEPNFSANDINKLAWEYLQSMPEDEVLEIAGSGSFDRKELMDQIERRTSVGVQIIEMILADRSFVERQIRRGNYDDPTNYERG